MDRFDASHVRFVPSRNYDSRGAASIDTIIIHHTGRGGLDGAIETLTDPNRVNPVTGKRDRVSAHYVIGKGGEIVQLVKDANNAWHAGSRAVNSSSIGIELVNSGNGVEPFTAAQMQSLTGLVGHLVQEYGIPFDHILGHSQVSSDRSNEPAQNFDWGHFLNDVIDAVEDTCVGGDLGPVCPADDRSFICEAPGGPEPGQSGDYSALDANMTGPHGNEVHVGPQAGDSVSQPTGPSGVEPGQSGDYSAPDANMTGPHGNEVHVGPQPGDSVSQPAGPSGLDPAESGGYSAPNAEMTDAHGNEVHGGPQPGDSVSQPAGPSGLDPAQSGDYQATQADYDPGHSGDHQATQADYDPGHSGDHQATQVDYDPGHSGDHQATQVDYDPGHSGDHQATQVDYDPGHSGDHQATQADSDSGQ